VTPLPVSPSQLLGGVGGAWAQPGSREQQGQWSLPSYAGMKSPRAPSFPDTWAERRAGSTLGTVVPLLDQPGSGELPMLEASK
jgi:hypothetical protein